MGRIATWEMKQQRAELTYEALVAAAATVFAEGGFEAAQTPEIAERAGVSTGTLYRYFDDKRALFIEVLRRHLRRAHDDVTAELAPARFTKADPRAAIDEIIDVIFAHTKRHAKIERVYAAMSVTDPEVEALRLDFQRQRVAALSALIGALIPAHTAPSPAAAAQVIQAAALEVAADWHRFGAKVSPGLTQTEVKRALADMVSRYLFP